MEKNGLENKEKLISTLNKTLDVLYSNVLDKP